MSISQKDLRSTFLDLIAINSFHPNDGEIQQYIANRFTADGISFERDEYGNIIAKIDGEGESLMLNTHIDIPEDTPEVKYREDGDIIRATGETILGADPKTGLAVILEVVREIAKRGNSTSPIDVVLTRGEEQGLLGALNLDHSLVRAREGLVVDQDGPYTEVVKKAPGMVVFDGAFVGKTVHPREPEKGVNALNMAAEALASEPCGYATEGVTWNIGTFTSGTARNSVPGKASFQGELRGYDTEEVLKEAKRIQKRFAETAEAHHGKIELEPEVLFSGYDLSKAPDLQKRLENTFKEYNAQPNYFDTFGGSDANILNSYGIQCVPIGSGYYNAHEYTEYARLDDMEQLATFLLSFVKTH